MADPVIDLLAERLMSGVSGMPSFDELAATQAFKREQRGFPTDDLSGQFFDPFNPLEGYDFISSLRGGGKTGIDPGDQILHGDSRFKSPNHPTRFGVDRGDFITDRITGEEANLSDQDVLALILMGLAGER